MWVFDFRKTNWNAKIAYQVAQDVAVQVAQLRKEDFGPMCVIEES